MNNHQTLTQAPHKRDSARRSNPIIPSTTQSTSPYCEESAPSDAIVQPTQCMAARNQPSDATQHPTSTRRDILPARTPTSPTPPAFALPFAGVTAHHGLRAPYTLVRLPPRTQRDRTTVQHSNTAPFRSTTLYRPTCDTKPLTFAHTSNISPTHMAACLFQLYTTRMVTQVAVHGAKARARI